MKQIVFVFLVVIGCLWGNGLPGACEDDAVVAILQEDFPTQPSYADPVELQTFLQSKGMKCQLISADQLANREEFNSARYSIVILPYGACFPLTARAPFTQFLKQDGAFISMGGYAFDDLMEKKEGKWVKVETGDPSLFLSGRRGKPGDWIQYQPDQIVLFDPTFQFKRAVSIGRGFSSLPGGYQEALPMQLEGFPATAMTGNNSPVFGKSYARWYSLGNAYDRYNRNRGSVFALTFQYDGPYKGSAWAFSGATNVNLFSARYPGMLEMLEQAVKAIQLRVFLVDIEAKPPDESNSRIVVARVANCGRRVFTTDEKNILKLDRESTQIQISPGEIREIQKEVHITELRAYRPVEVTLAVGSDFQESLRCTIPPSRISGNPMDLSFSENYFQIKGRPVFLMGTNQTGIIWSSSTENSETWKRDLELMAQNGLSILRVLHFSPFAIEETGKGRRMSPLELAKNPPESLIRKTDELVTACALRQIALMLTLHDWMPVELTDEELEAQRAWARFWSKRYRDQKHVLFDIQNEPAISPEKSIHVQKLWNDFLKEQYQDDGPLKTAWGKYAGTESLGEIPCEAGADEWDNPRAYDFNRFRSSLLERWIHANREGIREGAPEKLATVGFLQFEWPADKFLPTQELTFSNTHYHGPFENFPPIFKLTDRRFRGQGLSVGEFGAWDAHQARSQGEFKDETEASIRHFLAVGHETLGMGGGLMMNWDLKDLNECVFPWGLTYMQQGQSMKEAVPKDWLDAYGKMSLFFSDFRPKYEPPELFFAIPDNHRLGAKSQTIHEALHNALTLLFACHVNFGVINEKAIGELPQQVRTLIWPIPYCPDDEVFEKIAQFVQNSGNLYFSGGIGFDPQRRPARSERYQRFGLPTQEPVVPFAATNLTERRDWITAELGKGKVFFMPSPIELEKFDRLPWNPYKEFLRKTGTPAIEVHPDDPKLHIFSIPETNGSRIYTLFRNEKDANPREYELKTPQGILKLSLKGTETGLAKIDAQGNLTAVEGAGEIRWNGDDVLKTSAHAMVWFLESDNHLSGRRSVWILPTRPGTMQIAVKNIASPKGTIGRWRVDDWSGNNCFQYYDRLVFSRQDSNLCFTIDEDMAASMIFIEEPIER